MQWVVTAFVLGSVSVLVVVLTIEQDAQALGHRGGIAISTTGSLLLRRALALLRSAAVSSGSHLGRLGRSAAHALGSLMVSAGENLRTRAVPWVRQAAERARRRRLRFTECLIVTGPAVLAGAARPAKLSLARVPERTGTLDRVLAAVQLAGMILVVGGIIAAAVLALGWKAARLF
jgi:hypothetical protein